MKCWIKGNKITMIRAIIFMLIRWSGTPTSPESSSVQTMVYMSFRLTVWYRYKIIKHWGWINGDAEKRHCGFFFHYISQPQRERERLNTHWKTHISESPVFCYWIVLQCFVVCPQHHWDISPVRQTFSTSPMLAQL